MTTRGKLAVSVIGDDDAPQRRGDLHAHAPRPMQAPARSFGAKTGFVLAPSRASSCHSALRSAPGPWGFKRPRIRSVLAEATHVVADVGSPPVFYVRISIGNEEYQTGNSSGLTPKASARRGQQRPCEPSRPLRTRDAAALPGPRAVHEGPGVHHRRHPDLGGHRGDAARRPEGRPRPRHVPRQPQVTRASAPRQDVESSSLLVAPAAQGSYRPSQRSLAIPSASHPAVSSGTPLGTRAGPLGWN